MKRYWPLALLVTTGALAAWIGLYPVDWENWLGFSKYDYFTAGTNYAFTSGPGPMFLTAVGLSTIIAGLWHHVNCHEPGCMRIGRHKIDGTPWCNTHQGKARERADATLNDVVEAVKELQAVILDIHYGRR